VASRTLVAPNFWPDCVNEEQNTTIVDRDPIGCPLLHAFRCRDQHPRGAQRPPLPSPRGEDEVGSITGDAEFAALEGGEETRRLPVVAVATECVRDE